MATSEGSESSGDESRRWIDQKIGIIEYPLALPLPLSPIVCCFVPDAHIEGGGNERFETLFLVPGSPAGQGGDDRLSLVILVFRMRNRTAAPEALGRCREMRHPVIGPFGSLPVPRVPGLGVSKRQLCDSRHSPVQLYGINCLPPGKIND
jgi:hypothetical protein